MNKISTFAKLIYDKDYRFRFLVDTGIYNRLPDDVYLKRFFHAKMGKELDLKNPRTFNEKIQWLKLYDRNPTYIDYVDKYKAKSVVAKLIGEEHIIPTIGCWSDARDIDFTSLPKSFVLKCTHDSGGVVLCRDKSKLDIKATVEKLNKSRKKNFYYYGREWVYKNIKPLIIAEPFLQDPVSDKDITDYKFMCFDGCVKCIFTCTDRRSDSGMKVTFFDKEWTRLPFTRHYPQSVKKIEKPVNLDLMIKLSEKLSANIPFVRVDFYEVDNEVFFGELTFYPGNGMEEFEPEEWDYKLGEWIKLPEKA